MTALPAGTLAARALAAFTPLPTPRAPHDVLTMQTARLRSSIAWLAAGVVGAHLAGLQTPWIVASASGWVWFSMTALVAMAMLAVGSAQLLLLVRAEGRRLPVVAAVSTLVALGILLAPMAGFLVFIGGVVHLGAPLVVMAVGIALLSFDPSLRARMPRPWLGAALGVVAAASVVAVGVLDSLVLLPLAMAPGMSLPEIHASLDAAGEAGGTWLPFAWAGVWLAAATLLALGLLRNRRSQRGTFGLLLAAAVAAVFGLPLSQFSIGMSMGDTMMTEAVASAAFPPLLLTGTLLAALATASLIGAQRSSGRPE